ncbi:MAG: nucleoside monophosphate kinase, partial [Candidatus Omnitrophica bacterium]|nr:nucleoside monophosphate kinase [Candidatus Omnitrophota bacterium]
MINFRCKKKTQVCFKCIAVILIQLFLAADISLAKIDSIAKSDFSSKRSTLAPRVYLNSNNLQLDFKDFLSNSKKFNIRNISDDIKRLFPRHILILGNSGSGKGVLAERYSEQFDIPIISTGDMIRGHIRKGGKIGRRFLDVQKGNLAPTDMIIEMVKEKLESLDLEKGFIFDGFPRAPEELDFILSWAKEKGIDLVPVYLYVSDATARKRIVQRGTKKFRDDDLNVEAINKRLANFRNTIRPDIIERLLQHDNIICVNGEKDVDKVYTEFIDKLFSYEYALVKESKEFKKLDLDREVMGLDVVKDQDGKYFLAFGDPFYERYQYEQFVYNLLGDKAPIVECRAAYLKGFDKSSFKYENNYGPLVGLTRIAASYDEEEVKKMSADRLESLIVLYAFLRDNEHYLFSTNTRRGNWNTYPLVFEDKTYYLSYDHNPGSTSYGNIISILRTGIEEFVSGCPFFDQVDFSKIDFNILEQKVSEFEAMSNDQIEVISHEAKYTSEQVKELLGIF